MDKTRHNLSYFVDFDVTINYQLSLLKAWLRKLSNWKTNICLSSWILTSTFVLAFLRRPRKLVFCNSENKNIKIVPVIKSCDLSHKYTSYIGLYKFGPLLHTHHHNHEITCLLVK